MRKKWSAVVGLLCTIIIAVVAGAISRRASAQAGSFHVITVTSGGSACHDMTTNLQADRDAWRAVYGNYIAGYITGANFVSYSVGGRNANVGSAEQETREIVFTSVEQYCAHNPTSNIAEAVTRVYSQLVAR